MSGVPSVAKLPPREGLLNDHHGASSNSIGLTVADKPLAFHNPWPSYRFATLNDAWIAYQKGAAVATPQRQATPSDEWSRVSSRSNSRAGSRDDGGSRRGANGPIALGGGNDSAPAGMCGVGRLFYDPDDDDPDSPPEIGGADDESDELSYVPKRTEQGHEAVTGWIRPSLKSIQPEDDDDDWREPPVRVVPPRWIEDGMSAGDSGTKPCVTWLGHASVLIQVPFADGKGMCGILFDPIFSNRCSPTQYVGPARSIDPPCSVAELPPVHLVLLSHDHYDHLDYNSLKDLWNYHNETVYFVVPLSELKHMLPELTPDVKRFFTLSGVPKDRVIELDWWNEALVQFPASESRPSMKVPKKKNKDEKVELDPTSRLSLKLACLPAQHRSGRGLLDQMTTLWASWAFGVVDPDFDPLEPGMADWRTFKVYFGGDTGYRYATAPDSEGDSAVCPAFQQIGEAYGPFSLALLAISAGSSLPFLRKTFNLSLDQYTLTSSQHCSPEDAIAIHLKVKSERSLAIHWGTFCDSAEARATRVEFGRARRQAGVSADWDDPGPKGAFVIRDIGQTINIP